MSNHSLSLEAEEKAADEKTFLGFWIYLMTDVILFGTLFATYIVLHKNTNGGTSGAELFELPTILVATLILLTSSFTCGLAMLTAHRKQLKWTLFWLGLTAILGVIFVALEFMEFEHLVATGNSWQLSGFLSGFFTLVGTHGLHILFGLLWAGVLIYLLIRRGFTRGVVRRLTLFSMFWHFLDIIWIFIFTFVYLMGGLGV